MEKHQKTEPVQGKADAPHKRTGATNIEYDLFSEVHHLLKGNAALERYIEDARDAGDREAESCFKAIHDQNKDSVGKLREMLGRHLAKAA
jgi:hypothetical protein